MSAILVEHNNGENGQQMLGVHLLFPALHECIQPLIIHWSWHLPHMQVNYLIDEGANIGKGANCIISLLHHFLSHHNLGEINLTFHADNCSGQNKNRYVMQYMAWRVLAGLNKSIEISFLLVGHTKFAPDWCFGLLKRRFRRANVGCLQDIVDVTNSSAEVNHAQLVANEDGTVIVPQYDWANFFAPFFKRNAFAGIKALHHLKFSSSRPGEAMVRDTTDSGEKTIAILHKDYLHWRPTPTDLPPTITLPGLSRERKEYLFDKIREYCPPHCKNIVCPNPNNTPPSSPTCGSLTISPSLPSPKRPCQRAENTLSP